MVRVLGRLGFWGKGGREGLDWVLAGKELQEGAEEPQNLSLLGCAERCNNGSYSAGVF